MTIYDISMYTLSYTYEHERLHTVFSLHVTVTLQTMNHSVCQQNAAILHSLMTLLTCILCLKDEFRTDIKNLFEENCVHLLS